MAPRRSLIASTRSVRRSIRPPSSEALTTIFEDADLETQSATYSFPAQIFSEETPDSQAFPAFLNASILAKKPLDWIESARASRAGALGGHAKYGGEAAA
jgi:hypothetical protein